jgi:hypothetical protein
MAIASLESRIILVTFLEVGQQATVLQLPVTHAKSAGGESTILAPRHHCSPRSIAGR